MNGAASPALLRLLFALAGGFVFASMAALSLAAPGPLAPWLPVAIWAGCSGSAVLLLARWLPRHDRLLLLIPILLSGWGIVAIARLEPDFAQRQALWLALSIAAMLAVAAAPGLLRRLHRLRYILLTLALLLLIATMLFGSNPSGAVAAPQLWLGAGGVYFQPSEFLKVILVAVLASYLAERGGQRVAPGGLGRLGPALLMGLLSLALLVWQRDLGTAVLYFVVFLLLFYAASGDWRALAGGTALVLGAGVVATELFAVVQLRVDIWLDPWSQAAGRAYQIVQSLMAFAAGGIVGTGAGGGLPGYIPLAHSDFIFAAIAEEWGLLGIGGILCCWGVLAWRGCSLAVLQGGAYPRLLALGLTLMLTVQALLIMAGVLKLLPLTGVTLPFMSYGGSSLLASHIMLALLLRLSAELP